MKTQPNFASTYLCAPANHEVLNLLNPRSAGSLKYATQGSYIWKKVKDSTLLRLGKTITSEQIHLASAADEIIIFYN